MKSIRPRGSLLQGRLGEGHEGARAGDANGCVCTDTHNNPEKALSDGAQSLYPHQFETLMGELRVIAPVLCRTLPLARVSTVEGRG